MRPRPSTSRIPHLGAALVLALVAGIHAWDWLTADRMPPGDFPGYAAQVQYVRDALLHHGRVPLWCGECYGGTTNLTGHLKEYLAFPLAAALEPVLATKLLFVILKWLAALGLYAAVVRFFASPGVGLVAAYAYGFGAVANHQLAHLDLALASALAPYLFIAAAELLRLRRASRAIALGALVACQFVNNWVHAFSAPFVVLFLAALRPWRAARADESPWRDRALAARWAVLGAGAFVVFLAFAGSQLAWLASDADHHALFTPGYAAERRGVYIERSPFLFVNRDNVLGPWLARHHPPGLDVSVLDGGRRYLGLVVLALCAAGAIAGRRDATLRRWAGVATLALLLQYWMALGSRTLLWEVAESLHWGPETQTLLAWVLRAGAVCSLLAGVALAFRAGRRRSGASWGPALAAWSAAGLLFFPTQSLWPIASGLLPLLEVQRSPGHYFDTAPFWVYLLFALALLAIERRLPRASLRRLFLGVVLLAVAVDFWPSARNFSKGTPLAPLRQAGEMLRDLPHDDGTLRLALRRVYSPLDSWVAEQSRAGPTWGWLYWQATRHWLDFTGAAVPSLRKTAPPRPARVRLLATGRIRYFLVDDRFEGMRQPPPPWRPLRSAGPYTVWAQPFAGPMASGFGAYVWLADDARSDATDLLLRALRENALLVSALPDSARASELAEGARVILAPNASVYEGRGNALAPDDRWEERLRRPPVAPPFEVTYRRPQPEHIHLETPGSEEPAMVFVSEAYHPWWRATVDGAPAPVFRAQVAFMAVAVPPGAHEVDLRLRRPVAVAAADGVSAAAWTALALAVPAAALVRRGRRSARNAVQRTP